MLAAMMGRVVGAAPSMKLMTGALALVGMALPLDDAGAQPRRKLGSDRSTIFEFKAGPYQPRIDSEFQVPAGADPASYEFPYEGSFGNDSPWMFLATYELQIFNDMGTLSSGVTAGYWSVSGTNGSLDPASEATEETGILMIPTQLGLTYRLDQLSDRLPIVPVVRLGLDYYLWQITRGDGEVAEFSNGNKAEGGTFGYHAGFGLHFLLDFLSPTMASDFDRDAGVNNSYLTFDYVYSQVDDFGSATSLRLGDSTFFVGLALDL